MTYTEAVQLALDGNERGFGFLYQDTYKSKLYLALQYMKNESDAEDVLQDAYVKAFSNLKDLKDPEKFSSWLGQIVANTAKNALVKKNPVLFTDIPTDEEEGEPFEEQIADEDTSTQPELSYTREETRQMVDELIDSLSDEQRVCILMYHMEDMPIKDIAAALDCSESTVKSRLNYGRKNLKAKAEELQKKGYKLYSLAPLALLTLLLHTNAEAAYADPSFSAAGRRISNEVFEEIPALNQDTSPGADEVQAETAEEASEEAESTSESGEAGETADTEMSESGEASDAVEGELKTAEETEEAGEEAAENTAGGTDGPDAGTAAQAGETETSTGSAAHPDGETSTGTGPAPQTGEAGTGAAAQAGGYGSGAAAQAGGTGAGAAAKAGAGSAARAGFLGTTAGKVVIGAAVVIVAGGAIFGISRVVQNNNTDDEVVEEAPAIQEEEPDTAVPEPEIAEEEEEIETEEAGEEETVEVVSVTTEMYPDLLEGGLTKSQFEELLGYVPVGTTNGQVSSRDMSLILEDLAFDCFFRFSDSPEKLIGVEGSYSNQYDGERGDIDGYFYFDLAQMNNYLSVLITEPLTEDYLDSGRGDYESRISGDRLRVVKEAGDYGLSQKATITDAVQSGDTIIANFSVELYNSVRTTYDSRYVTLKQTEDGKYRIDSVSSGSVDLSTATQESDVSSSVTNLYIGTLKDVAADKYTFENAVGEILGYEYFLTDMNGDNVPDLVVGKLYNTGSETGTGVFNWYDCRIFTAESQSGGWTLNEVSGEVDLLSAFIPSDGKGLIATTDFGRGTGDAEYHRVIIEDNTVTVGESTQEEGTLVEWHDVGNLSGLSDISY